MFQAEQVSIILITLVLAVAFYVINRKMLHLDINQTPSRLMTSVIAYVDFIDGFVCQNMGKKHGRKIGAYIGALFIYLLIANFSGLVGLPAPTSNFSVTLVLALITWTMVQYAKFSTVGVGGFIKGLFEPLPFFVIPNIISLFAPIISLSLRLFGNILSGTIIMSLFYMFAGWLSSFIPLIGEFNFFGVIVAPILHLYFDLFAGFLQAFLFISLTTIFIAVEYPEEETKTI